jgi:hypothetical protein
MDPLTEHAPWPTIAVGIAATELHVLLSGLYRSTDATVGTDVEYPPQNVDLSSNHAHAEVLSRFEHRCRLRPRVYATIVRCYTLEDRIAIFASSCQNQLVFLEQVYTEKVKFALQSPKHAHVTLVARSHHAVAPARVRTRCRPGRGSSCHRPTLPARTGLPQ